MKWISVDELPEGDMKVLMKGVNSGYKFGYPQLLAGFFIKRYYDTVLDEFRVTGHQGDFWKITHYMDANFLPEPPTK